MTRDIPRSAARFRPTWAAYELDLLGSPQELRPRFWSKVSIRGVGDCWPWLAFKRGSGYGMFSISGQSPRTQRAARVAYALERGPIPAGMTVDHLCNHPDCVNPSHLELVEKGENTRRQRDRNQSCKRGHPYTPENTSILKSGGRRCRQCKREHERERIAKARGHFGDSV